MPLLAEQRLTIKAAHRTNATTAAPGTKVDPRAPDLSTNIC